MAALQEKQICIHLHLADSSNQKSPAKSSI